MRGLPSYQGERGVTLGLLDSLTDPESMARIAERNRIVGRLAEQMGITRAEARRALFDFEAVTGSDGQTLH
jgi:hypothetical protein